MNLDDIIRIGIENWFVIALIVLATIFIIWSYINKRESERVPVTNTKLVGTPPIPSQIRIRPSANELKKLLLQFNTLNKEVESIDEKILELSEKKIALVEEAKDIMDQYNELRALYDVE